MLAVVSIDGTRLQSLPGAPGKAEVRLTGKLMPGPKFYRFGFERREAASQAPKPCPAAPGQTRLAAGWNPASDTFPHHQPSITFRHWLEKIEEGNSLAIASSTYISQLQMC